MAKDPEVRAAIDSFRFLKPAPMLPLTGTTRAYDFGAFLGKTMAFGMIMKIPNGVVWAIKRIWI